MRIVSWNLGHQTMPRPIKPAFSDAIASLQPDVLFLNEYVHDEKLRAPMLAALKDLGLSHWLVSEQIGRPPESIGAKPKRNNQVLVAARSSLRIGDLRGPATHDRGGEANFLHVFVEGLPFEIVGLRVPAYVGKPLKLYWEEFKKLAEQVAGRPIAFIGDFNADPDNARYVGGSVLADFRRKGWQLPAPEGEWSFKSGKQIGLSGTRIDHILASNKVPPMKARYVSQEGGIVLAGEKSIAISDHAALVVDI